jgi:hypothetical protein
MKRSLRFILGALLACSLAACIFKEPVYTKGFLKIDPRLGGVWASQSKEDDPRKTEFAVCAPVDEEHLLINSPAADKSGVYYEARMLKVRDRTLLQLRSLASFNAGLPKADDEIYTLLWIEGDLNGASLKVRALDGNRLKGKSPAEVRGMLENPAEDWNNLFSEAVDYRRLANNP